MAPHAGQIDRGEPEVVGVEGGEGLQRGEEHDQDDDDDDDPHASTARRSTRQVRQILRGAHWGRSLRLGRGQEATAPGVGGRAGMPGGKYLAATEGSGQSVVVTIGTLRAPVVDDPSQRDGRWRRRQRCPREGGQGLIAGQALDTSTLPVAKRGTRRVRSGRCRRRRRPTRRRHRDADGEGGRWRPPDHRPRRRPAGASSGFPPAKVAPDRAASFRCSRAAVT